MSDDFEELYDYDVLRRLDEATMFVVRTDHLTLVLGGRQSADVLNPGAITELDVRRRRGGGGLVLLQPDDLWVDWWIPTDDPRWRPDVRRSSLLAGEWWLSALRSRVGEELRVHEGGLEGEPAHRVACFAGRGPGEVLLDGRKVVGVTQWRVREGIFLSTVLPAHSSSGLVRVLAEPVSGLDRALQHHTYVSLGIDDPESVVDELTSVSGPWRRRQLLLQR